MAGECGYSTLKSRGMKHDRELADELKDVLSVTRDVSEELLSRLGAQDLSPVEVVGMLESLARVDQRRADILSRFRSASAVRVRREKERSIRQFVLGALEEVEFPQTAGFLEDYLNARELAGFQSRGVGALRRDEWRAWRNDRAHSRSRPAYIVPCLEEDGRKATGWMARSDWPLTRRLRVAGAEELWVASRVTALVRAYRDAVEEAGSLFISLIDRYAREALGDEVVDSLANRADRIEEFEEAANQRVEALRASVELAQEQAARRFTDWDDERLLWGATPTGDSADAALAAEARDAV